MLFLVFVSTVVGAGATGINFLALGDWGGSPLPPYTRHGQVAAVKGMDKVATALNADFIVAVGDNFYTEGVDSADSKRFEDTFNSVYSPASLQKDWFVCAGNHDHKGNVSAQIEYSGINSRWKFPSEYHTHSFSADGVTLDLIMLDTSSLASVNPVFDETAKGYFDPLPEVPRSYGETQWEWIEAQLKASTADYVIVGGHYPVYSACEHGNTNTLITNLKPLLETYEAHYISGHDHCMEHIVETGSKVNHILTGMGDGCCYWAENKDNVPKDSLKWYISRNNAGLTSAGFTSLSASADGLSVVYYDQDGSVLYTAPTIAPRTVSKK